MKKPDTLKQILSLCLIWLLISAVLWGRISIGVSDAMTAFTVCVDLENADTDTLEEKLSNCLPDSGRRVQVRKSSYFVFGGSSEETAEVFLVPESELEDYVNFSAEPILIYAPDSGQGLPAGWLGEPSENCYLLLGDGASEEAEQTIELFCELYGG